MVGIIGYDKNNQELHLYDICKFTIDKKEYEGMIDYNEEYFAYTFEMQSDEFPSVLMSKADLGSIKFIINVYSTKVDDEKYKFYQNWVNNCK